MCEVVCFEVFVWGLSANDGVCIFVLLVICVSCPVLDATGSFVIPSLEYKLEFSLINTPWGQEFSGSLQFWIQHSHSKVSGLIFGRGTQIPQAIFYGIEGDLNKQESLLKTK